MCPLFDYKCKKCGEVEERYVSSPDKVINCNKCGGEVDKLFTGSYRIKVKYPLWVDRFDDSQKRQVERGEKPTVPHPKEIL